MRRATTMIVPAAVFSFSTLLMCSGCDRKEKVIEIETPNRAVTVERDKDDGTVEVNVGK